MKKNISDLKSVSAKKLYKILKIIKGDGTTNYEVYMHFVNMFLENKIDLISCDVTNGIFYSKCNEKERDEFKKYLNASYGHNKITFDNCTFSSFDIIKEKCKEYICLTLNCYNGDALYGFRHDLRWVATFKLNEDDLKIISSFILSSYENYLSAAYDIMLEKRKTDWIAKKFNSIK